MTTDSGLDMSVEYTYENDLLTAITTPTTTYSFGYGDFALRETVKIGSKILAAYTYTEQNKYLQALDYGNGDSVQYLYDTYDSANQLIREDNQAANKSYIWIYDNVGNIRHTEEFAYTAPDIQLTRTDNEDVYTYGSQTWGDLLMAYNGTTIQYDASGNPVAHGSTRYTWEHGRQLASMTKDGTVWNYSYNNAGLRTGRTGGGTTYKYIYSGGQLMQLTKGNDVVSFTYDAGGNPLTMKVGDSTYYYVTNVQGDVMALLDADGNVAVSYRYTAYGVAEITSGANTTAANFNPLTYRGYVYDSETGLYYLQSRYYDPELGRFINADGLVATGQGLTGNNMFAYCGNNPVGRKDACGQLWVEVLIVVVAAVGVVAVGAAKDVADRAIDNSGANNVEKILAKQDYAAAFLVNEARKITKRYIKKAYGEVQEKDGSQVNAYRHAMWSAIMTDLMGEEKAKLFGTAHEADSKNAKEHKKMDLHNNALGRRIALEYAGQGYDVFSKKILEAIENGEAMVLKWDQSIK